MVNAQEWLNQNYQEYSIKDERENIIILNISNKELEGHLDLSDFVNLKELFCECNCLTSLNISKNHKLEKIDLWRNNIRANLDIFSHLIHLKSLNLGLPYSYGNDFYGSLKALENCKQLEYLCIGQNKEITEGLEYLPTEKLIQFDSCGTVFQEILHYSFAEPEKSLNRLKKWQKANPKPKNLEQEINQSLIDKINWQKPASFLAILIVIILGVVIIIKKSYPIKRTKF